MSREEEILKQLIEMARRLGDPGRDLVILGEGNVSAKVDEETFFVKASGETLAAAGENSFVRMSFSRVLDSIQGKDLSDQEVKEVLSESRVDRSSERMPSLEAFLHSYLLSLPNNRFIGHTHPTAVNAILCSAKSREAVGGRLFPDEIICCGPALCYVEYADPGLPLANQLRKRVEEFIDKEHTPPKIILMENHGLIACGRTPKDVETAAFMYVKTARILLGTYLLGGPRFLSPAHVDRIFTRPDEEYRRIKLVT